MQFEQLEIPDVVLITPKLFGDDRGFFMETFREDIFKQHCGDYSFVQDNHSCSSKGILRGLHYQTSRTQGKLVRVVSGEVFDVAVDMRKSLPTYGNWVGVNLTVENKKMLWVPPGFAHGFYVLSERAEFVYKCTDYYTPESEVSIRWDDPEIGIEWPLAEGELPALSEKDSAGVSFSIAPAF